MTTRYDNSGAADWALETRAIHVGQAPDAQTSSRNLPIYNTTSYVFDSAEHAANRFNLSDAGPIYSRLTNPTVDAVEQRLANLEGGVAGVMFASGQAAETAARHFSGQVDLLLIAVDGAALGDKLVYEPSRGGDLFPHLYAPLPLTAVLWETPLSLGHDGQHQFPEIL